MKAHAEGMYSETDTPEWHTSPSYLALQVPTAATNPAFTSGLSAGYFVPASNPGFALYRTQNPTQIPAFATGAYIPGVLYRPIAEGGNPLFGVGSSVGSRKFKAWRISGGLNGTFDNGWGWDVSSTYMEENLVRTGYDTLVSRFQLALRGLGGPGCNPATGTPGVGGCQYFNPFSNAVQSNYITGQTNPNFSAAVANDPALIRWFFPQLRTMRRPSSGWSTPCSTARPAINLSGGPVPGRSAASIARAGTRRATTRSPTSRSRPASTQPARPAPCAMGPSCSWGARRRPTCRATSGRGSPNSACRSPTAIQASLAARYEDYGSKGGSTFNPKLSMRWQINDIFALRGSVGTTFRAPPLTSLDPGQVTSLQFLGGAFRAVDVVGNPGLDPEKATTYSVGFITKAGPFRATVDYWNFDFKNPLVTEPVGGMFSSMFPLGTGTGNCGNPAFAGLQSRFTFNGACNVATLSRILTRAINGPKVKTDGIDILADFDVDNVWNGGMRFGTSMTYVHKYTVAATTVEGVVVSPAFDGVNHLNYQTQIYPIPQWKAQVYAEYNQGPHNVRATLNYVDSYIDQRTSPFAPNVVRDGGEQCGSADQQGPEDQVL